MSTLLLGLDTVLLTAGISPPKVLNVNSKMPFDLPPVSYTLRTEDGVSTRISEEGKRRGVHSPLQWQLHSMLIELADAGKVSLRAGVTEIHEFPPKVMSINSLTELTEVDTWIATIGRLTGGTLAPAALAGRTAGIP